MQADPRYAPELRVLQLCCDEVGTWPNVVIAIMARAGIQPFRGDRSEAASLKAALRAYRQEVVLPALRAASLPIAETLAH